MSIPDDSTPVRYVSNTSGRDEAMRETRRLQAEITAQRELVKELMSQQSA